MYYKEIAEMLGLEPGEPFYIENVETKALLKNENDEPIEFIITRDGIFNRSILSEGTILLGLTKGQYRPVKSLREDKAITDLKLYLTKVWHETQKHQDAICEKMRSFPSYNKYGDISERICRFNDYIELLVDELDPKWDIEGEAEKLE